MANFPRSLSTSHHSDDIFEATVRNTNFTEVLLKFDTHSAVCDGASKLVEIYINFDFCVFICPTELLNFLKFGLLLPCLSPSTFSLCLLKRTRANEDRIPAIYFSITFEVLRSLNSEVLTPLLLKLFVLLV